MIKRLLTVFLFVIILPLTSYSKDELSFFDVPDDALASIISELRPRLKDFKISDTEYVGAETAAELADPLLTNAEVEIALVRGIISVTSEWCKLDWKARSFKPFMKEMRKEGKTPKQMAYIGALHGFGMGIMDKKYKEMECSDAQIGKVKPFLYKIVE